MTEPDELERLAEIEAFQCSPEERAMRQIAVIFDERLSEMVRNSNTAALRNMGFLKLAEAISV